jgi:hypothetical protein
MPEQGRNKQMLKKSALILALGFAAGGCTHLSPSLEGQAVAREDLKNAQGHVVGYKEVMRDKATGERITQIALFVPRLDERGRIVGYEERVRGGSVLHDLHGKKIGGRFVDLRSRGTNPNNRGVMIVVLPREDRVARVAAPSIDELIRLARLEN